MQGQKGAIGSSQEGLPLEHGSTSSDSGVVEQQPCWTNFTNQETQNLSLWSMGESSSSMTNQVSDHHDPPPSVLSLGDVNMNATHNYANIGHHLHHGHNVTVNPSTFIGIKPSHYASGSSSGPFEMEARQRPSKRKAAELTVGQSSSGIISPNVFRRPKDSNDDNRQLNLISSDPIIPRLGLGPGAGVGVLSDNHAAENNRRNVRIRINNSRQQDQLPASNNNNINRQINFSSPYPSLGLNPVATTGENSSSHESQTMLRIPALRRNLQVTSTRNRSSSSRASRPVSSNVIGGSGENLRTMPANISDHPLFIQPHDVRNTAPTAINWNLNSGGGNGSGNVTHNGNSVGSTTNPVASLGPRHGSSLYPSRRLSEILQLSLLPSIDSGGGGGGGESSNLFSRLPPPVRTSASSSQESAIPPVIGITNHNPRHRLPRLRPVDRQFDGAFGLPHLARTTAGGSERRGRLVSEIRNVLDLIRRGEGLRFEDVMVLDQSVFYGMAGIYDRHRDMRLDIDNMSYEELLALEERIGNVNTGLTDEQVSKCVETKTYASVTCQPDAEPCCICQEEYKDGDNVGALECGHDFHTSCIKQWLTQKNLCPICKSAASK